MSKLKFFSSGQSLFEVILALGLITLIMVTIVALAGISIKNSSFSRNKTLSARNCEAALEWLRGQRDESWDDFSERAQTPKWCIPTLSWNEAKTGNCTNSDEISGTNLKREIDFSIIDTANIQTQIKVYWIDAGGYHEVNSITIFTDWRTQ